MPEPIYDHLAAAAGVTLDGFGYPSAPNFAGLPPAGEPGEIRYTTDDGTGYRWNPVSGQWEAPAGGTSSVHTATLTGDGTTTDFTVTHNLDTINPVTVLVDDDALNAGANRAVIAGPAPSQITANDYRLVFAAAPAAGETFTAVTAPAASSGGGGGGATSVHSVDGNGRLILNDGAGTIINVRHDTPSKTLFATREWVTTVSDSAPEVFTEDWEIYAYRVIAATAPTGDETFDLFDSTAAAVITPMTLASGATDTGLQAIGAPYTLPAGNLMIGRILTVNGSEGLVIHTWRRPVGGGMAAA